jgi:hypothetical protein
LWRSTRRGTGERSGGVCPNAVGRGRAMEADGTVPSVSGRSAVSGGGRFRHPQANKTGRPPTTTASPLSPTSQCPLRALAPHLIRANYPKASCFPNGGNRRLTLSCRIPDSCESVGSFSGVCVDLVGRGRRRRSLVQICGVFPRGNSWWVTWSGRMIGCCGTPSWNAEGSAGRRLDSGRGGGGGRRR